MRDLGKLPSDAPGYGKPAIFGAFTSYRLQTLTGNSFLMCNESKQFILNATFFFSFYAQQNEDVSLPVLLPASTSEELQL